MALPSTPAMNAPVLPYDQLRTAVQANDLARVQQLRREGVNIGHLRYQNFYLLRLSVTVVSSAIMRELLSWGVTLENLRQSGILKEFLKFPYPDTIEVLNVFREYGLNGDDLRYTILFSLGADVDVYLNEHGNLGYASQETLTAITEYLRAWNAEPPRFAPGITPDDDERIDFLLDATSHIEILRQHRNVWATLEDLRAQNYRVFRAALSYGIREILEFMWSWGLTLEDARNDHSIMIIDALEDESASSLRFLRDIGLTAENLRDAFATHHGETLESFAYDEDDEISRFLREWAGLPEQREVMVFPDTLELQMQALRNAITSRNIRALVDYHDQENGPDSNFLRENNHELWRLAIRSGDPEILDELWNWGITLDDLRESNSLIVALENHTNEVSLVFLQRWGMTRNDLIAALTQRPHLFSPTDESIRGHFLRRWLAEDVRPVARVPIPSAPIIIMIPRSEWTQYGNHKIREAVRKSDIDSIQRMEGITVEDVRENNCELLRLAIFIGSTIIAQFFWNKGLTVNDLRVQNNVMLFTAVRNNSVPMLAFLQGCGLTVEDANDPVTKPYELAVKQSHPGVLDFFSEWREETFTCNGEELVCGICTSPLISLANGLVSADTVLYGTRCYHVFHEEHLLEWLNTGKNTCPMCRQDLGNNFKQLRILAGTTSEQACADITRELLRPASS